MAGPATDLKTLFQQDGVLILEQFFTPEELSAVNAALDKRWTQILSESVDEEYLAAYAHIECEVVPWADAEKVDDAVAALFNHPRLAETTQQLLDPGFSHLHTLLMFTHPQGRGQSWHQDCRAANDEHYNVNRLIYTRDTTLKDGAVVVVPGSHLGGDIPHGDTQDPIDGEVVITPTAGTLVFLHGRCFHRVTANHTDRPRVSVNFRVKSPGTSDGILNRPVYRHMDEAQRNAFNSHLAHDD